MKNNLRRSEKYIFIVLMLFSIILSNKVSVSEPRLPELKKGMTNLEVVKLWGSPEEKIEKEIKRIDIWIYKNSKLVFNRGTLVSIEDSQGVDILAAAQNTPIVDKSANQASQNQIANQDVVDDILSEIMKDPSNSEGENKPLNPGTTIIQPNVINQIPPPEIVQ